MPIKKSSKDFWRKIDRVFQNVDEISKNLPGNKEIRLRIRLKRKSPEHARNLLLFRV